MPVHETKECRPLGSERHQAPETGDAIVDASEAQSVPEHCLVTADSGLTESVLDGLNNIHRA